MAVPKTKSLRIGYKLYLFICITGISPCQKLSTGTISGLLTSVSHLSMNCRCKINCIGLWLHKVHQIRHRQNLS